MLTLLVATVFISCEDDGTGGGGGGGTDDGFPDVTASGPGTSVEANQGDTLYYTIAATAGDADLNAITVNGSNGSLTTDRFIVDGSGVANNPFTLSGDDRQMFSKTIGIIASKDDTDYSIVVTQDNNKTVTSNFSINAILLPPSLDFTSMMSGTVTIEPGGVQNYPLTATLGDGDLATMLVTRNGMVLGESRISWNGSDVLSNPFDLEAEQLMGFDDVDLTIRASNMEGEGNYLAIVTDVNGLSDSVAFTIITETVGTPVDVAMGMFFNRSGQENGSFDFETNTNVSSSSEAADVRDLGIVSNTDPTWLQQLESANGATLKKVVPGMGTILESFSFDDIEDKEELAALFDGAVDYNSETVAAQDVFAVVTGEGTLAVFRIVAVNDDPVGNDDNYEIDIKK